MPTLSPCADCARFIRHDELTCPFCGAAATRRTTPGDALLERPPRVARSALVALAAAIATGSLASCSDRAVPPLPPPFVAPPSSTAVAPPEPEAAKPTPTTSVEIVASPPQAAPPLPEIPPVAAHTRRRVREEVRVEEVEQHIEQVNVAPPYGAAPVPADGSLC